MKILITESQYNKGIEKYLSYLFEPYELKKSDEYPKTVLFWVKDGKVIGEIQKNRIFWVSHKVWDDISKFFDLTFEETKEIIDKWLKTHSEIKGLTAKYDDLELFPEEPEQ
jgi:hypothetical protein